MMCGICGFITHKNASREILVKANNTMIHRGPDDSGAELYSLNAGYTLGLAQRRLAILDLSELGHQPMHSQDGRISVVYNGEIYNFKQIREQLNGYPFKTECDTEVIIAAYLRWGIKCVDHFNGMFAIGLFDRSDDSLYLVRDRIGKKPLYYYLDENDIYFASEIKPILCFPHIERKINKNILGRYLYHQYIASPDTVFQNLYKLKPGEILHYQYGEINRTIYWNPGQQYFDIQSEIAQELHYDDAKQHLKDLLVDSVKLRMIADVPVGTFLSGGIDSSLVSAIAADECDKAIQTFTIGFHEEQYNEAEHAKSIAELLGTKHTELYITEKDLFSMVSDLTTYYDEPFADSSQIPTMLVSKLAKEDVTVVLSGDGGDELFCGYNHYDSMAAAQKYDWMGKLIKRCFPDKIISQLPHKAVKLINNHDYRYKTQYDAYGYNQLINQCFIDNYYEIRYDESVILSEPDYQKRRMLLDQMTYLPDDILCKVDRGSMKYSLETRCPVLDYRVIEYAYQLPHEFKYKQGIKKYILKDIAYEYIPKALLDRPKKGFSAPIDKWLKGPLKEELLELSSAEYLKKQNLFKADILNSTIEKYVNGTQFEVYDFSRLVWSFYVFQKWYEQYL